MTVGGDDPWSSARSTAREDVHAALAPRERRCPTCGTVQQGGGRTCARCGADLTARHPRRRSGRKPLYISLAIALAVLAAIAVPVIGSLRDDADGEQARNAARQRALEAAERVRLTRDSLPVRADGTPRRAGAGQLEHRAKLVAEGETLIAADARARVAAGTLEGDIRGAECAPFPTTAARRAAEEQLSTRVGRYDCIAYTSKFEAPELKGQARTGLFGFPYWLVIDYAGAELVFCKVTPRPGEGGGRSLASVPVPEPCRDPPGAG